MSDAAALRLDQLGCIRGGRVLFAGVSVVLGAGDALVVGGPNGVGKSSLLRLAAGLLRPAGGAVVRSGRVALADEHPALDTAAPLALALERWRAIDGGDGDAALAATGLVPLASVPVRMLSTGQRRRATLARVIASRAAIWLLDEPGNGLDAAATAQLEQVIARHRAAGGIVVVTSHQPLALATAARIDLTHYRPVAA